MEFKLQPYRLFYHNIIKEIANRKYRERNPEPIINYRIITRGIIDVNKVKLLTSSYSPLYATQLLFYEGINEYMLLFSMATNSYVNNRDTFHSNIPNIRVLPINSKVGAVNVFDLYDLAQPYAGSSNKREITLNVGNTTLRLVFEKYTDYIEIIFANWTSTSDYISNIDSGAEFDGLFYNTLQMRTYSTNRKSDKLYRISSSSPMYCIVSVKEE